MNNVKEILEKATATYIESMENDTNRHNTPFTEDILFTLDDVDYRVSIRQEVDDINKLKVVIRNVMKQLRVPPHLTGFDYIVDAVALTYYDRESVHHVTKFLYPTLAKKYNSTISRVERAIRHSVDNTMVHGNKEMIYKLFYENTDHVPNSHFIAALTNYVTEIIEVH